MSIKIAIVEDNAGMRESIARLLNQAPGLSCVSTYATAEAAVRDLPFQKPDVALVDIHLPGMNGIQCVAKIKAQLPQMQVLMLTSYEQPDLIFDSIRAGASGYLLKTTPGAELIQAVQQVHAGGAPMTMQIARKVINHFRQIQKPAYDMEKLTPREQEVLALLARGYLYKEIANDLGISINTLRNHLRTIYDKLHVHSRTQATAKYLGRD
ncbi:MAG TPA: response regulator transcription factor [Verrucomicrobiae bacterium]|jgi:DNA-binding NarL/FixJ family response regulator|nr:response regulator transcription factor [Verrucomicrobiae bacterium]